MNLEARAPRIGFNLNLTTKNFVIVLMCAVFAFLFVQDGWFTYASINDWLVEHIVKPAVLENSTLPDPDFLHDWKGWNNESIENQRGMSKLVEAVKNSGKKEIVEPLQKGWKDSTSIKVQRWFAIGLLVALAGALWRFASNFRLRVSASDDTVSPKQGLAIPWDKITKVDNTDWRSYGIVKITYTDAAGQASTAQFDDYKTQREPLLKILDALSEKAVNAEFIPKEEPKDAGASAT